jgi:hypothetical protein
MTDNPKSYTFTILIIIAIMELASILGIYCYYENQIDIDSTKLMLSEQKIAEVSRDAEKSKLQAQQHKKEAEVSAVEEENERKKVKELEIVISDKEKDYTKLKAQLKKPVHGQVYTYADITEYIDVIDHCEDISKEKDKEIVLLKHYNLLLEKDRSLLFQSIREYEDTISNMEAISIEKDNIISQLRLAKKPSICGFKCKIIIGGATFAAGIYLGSKMNHKNIMIN